ncbi:proton-coupled amino acid transporter 1-like [Dendronephthya gigantea]|uniref:proton-coupled amino acid transporter 1-like n=1 Tax=Dendronephthya gigantea TaxID=151771 RepID=UPI00106BD042|nr:proton-coupled amino acid transporter 1-like [Dendronephthya gigantea]XP_028401922.1 proton-coupled amino acid transporter 1-like [Dendronephthya gigantea]
MEISHESTPLLVSKRLSDGSYQRHGSEESDDIICKQGRVKEKYLTDTQSLMHLLKASVGIGILGLPKALMNAGILVGPLLLALIALVTVHCIHMLLSCSKRLCVKTGKSAFNYGEIADECVKKFFPEYPYHGSAFVNTLICATQLGACTAYVLFIAENLHDGMVEFDAVDIKTKLYIPIILPFLIIFCLIRDLESLTWLSWLANIIMVIVLISIYQYLYGHLQSPSELEKFSNWGDLPLFFGTSTYAFEAIAIILPLENQTKNASHFPRIVNIGLAIVIVLYFNIAIFGYMTFQDECKGSVTLNLPKSKYYSAIKFLVSVAIFCTYYIQIYVFFHILEPIMMRRIKEKYHKHSIIFFRITTVCLTCGMAAAIPHLNDIVSLVGAGGASWLAFACPTVCHWIIFSDETSTLAAAKNIFILIFALIGCVSGTFASFRNMINDK